MMPVICDLMSANVVPAAPGWDVLTPITDERGAVVAFEADPIIAWCVELYRNAPAGHDPYDTRAYPYAVTADGGEYAEIVREPSGRIRFLADRSFDDEAAALAYAGALHGRRAATAPHTDARA